MKTIFLPKRLQWCRRDHSVRQFVRLLLGLPQLIRIEDQKELPAVKLRQGLRWPPPLRETPGGFPDSDLVQHVFGCLEVVGTRSQRPGRPCVVDQALLS